MKLIARINRGAILTAVVIIGVAVYLIILSISQGIAKNEIRKICADYIQTEISYTMLPEKYRSEKPVMPAAEWELYLSEMVEDLTSFYTENTTYNQLSITKMQNQLRSQMDGIGVIYDYQKTIKSFQSFEFEQGMVTVSLLSNTVIDGPLEGSLSGARQKVAGETTDTIILQKTAGVWKVLFANLVKPGSSNQWNRSNIGNMLDK